MTGPNLASLGEFLTIRVGGSATVPERLLLVGRPHDGLVRVHEWTTNTMNAEGEDYEIVPDELLTQLEDALAAQRQVSEEMYRIRMWLNG